MRGYLQPNSLQHVAIGASCESCDSAHDAVCDICALNAADDEDDQRPHGAVSSFNMAGMLDELDKEAGIMAALRHPNVVMFLGVCLEPPCMVAEVYTLALRCNQTLTSSSTIVIHVLNQHMCLALCICLWCFVIGLPVHTSFRQFWLALRPSTCAWQSASVSGALSLSCPCIPPSLSMTSTYYSHAYTGHTQYCVVYAHVQQDPASPAVHV